MISPHKLKTRAMAARAEGRERCDSGFAYVMALFMVLTVIIGSQIVLRNMVTVRRSEREAEMIWRGNQYARAVKMYYRKTGHFPGSQEDLVKGIVNVHFLRSEAMIDPMNGQDGAWRFIYTNASGAIIGSVKYGSLQQMALMDLNGGQMPGAQAGTANSNGQNGTNGISTNGISTNGNSASGGPMSTMGTGPTNLTSGLGTNGSRGALGGALNASIAGPQPTGPVTGQVFGGLLIGVGSTVDRVSVRVYKGGTKYNEWEFIWNPIEEQARAIQQGMGAAGAPAGLGGIPGLGLPIAPVFGGAAGGAAGNPGGTMTNGGGSNNSNGTGASSTNGGAAANPNPAGTGPDNSNPSGGGASNNPPPPSQ